MHFICFISRAYSKICFLERAFRFQLVTTSKTLDIPSNDANGSRKSAVDGLLFGSQHQYDFPFAARL